MGLTTERFWGLCDREYHALTEQFRRHQKGQSRMVAALRSDIYNTAGKSFDRHFEADDFLGEKVEGLEDRINALVAQGWDPAQAAAIASSKRSKSDNLRRIDMFVAGKKKRRA